MRPNHLLTAAGLLVVVLAACAPETVVTVPTLAILPSATLALPTIAPATVSTATATGISAPPSATAAPTETATDATATAIPPSDTPPVPTQPATVPPASRTSTTAPASATPSLTITFTVTPTPSMTLTPTTDAGGFSALIDLAGRVTVLPPDVRYGPGTATALWAIGDQLAATARAAATTPPTTGPAVTGVFAIVPGATLPEAGLGTLPPPPGGGATCGPTPGGALGALLTSDPTLASQLGCALGQPVQAAGALQPFERGLMIYRAPQTSGIPGTIEALTSDGRFTRYRDTWVSGLDPDSAGLNPPPGLVEPIRGFGKVWRGDGALAARLGWALAGEQGVNVTLQLFERGVALAIPAQNLTYVLADDGVGAAAGSWRQVPGGF